MKIKTQFIISMAIFSAVLLIVAASVILTNQQIVWLSEKQAISANIEQGADELNTVSSQYFLYQQTHLLTFWQSNITSISGNLSNLNSTSSEQQNLVNTARDDLSQLNASFTTLVSFLEMAPRNVSVRVIPEFQNYWNQTVTGHQTFGLDASRLSEYLRFQADQLRMTNIRLIIALLGVFGAFLITIYLIAYRRTLKSISNLQAGIEIIGSGNLDYSIQTKKEDEISELSQAFNQMTANLKTVTASKTDLEQVQSSLRESEQRWATTLASIGDAVIATDTSGRVEFMNGGAEKLTGWKLGEASGKSIKEVFNIVNKQTRLEVENPVIRVLKEGMIVGLANHTVLIGKDGTEVPIDDSGAPIKDVNGKTAGVVLIFRDITERKKSEEALNQLNEELEERVRERTEEVSIERQRLYNVLETLPAYVVLLDKDYCVPFANKVFRERFGESHGRRCYDFLFNRNSPCENCETYKVLKINGPHHWEWTGPDNRDYDIYDFPFVEPDGSNLILEMGLDITERKLSEKKAQESALKLKDSERLAAIGATAGMVGHDIRNPLQAITSDVYLAKSELASTPESEYKENALESLVEIEKNVSYINKIVQDLQDFAKPITPIAKETNLPKIIEDVLKKNGIPDQIKVHVKVNKEADILMADPEILRRILANLVTNAVQAMPEGGKLDIQAYRDSNDTMLSVKDTGVGIPEEVKAKLFTPLFTTKSKGQGFGLAVVKRMTEALGGTITFESEVGKGTKFIIRLPPRTKR